MPEATQTHRWWSVAQILVPEVGRPDLPSLG
jgi:hypothetical protein